VKLPGKKQGKAKRQPAPPSDPAKDARIIALSDEILVWLAEHWADQPGDEVAIALSMTSRRIIQGAARFDAAAKANEVKP